MRVQKQKTNQGSLQNKQKKNIEFFYDQYEQKYIYEKFHIFYGKASLIPEDSLKNILD